MTFYHQYYLDEAYQWLCRQRKNYHFNNDVWHLRVHWQAEKAKLLTTLQNETYTFDFVKKIQTPERITYLWSAKDALVLKMLAIHLRKVLAPASRWRLPVKKCMRKVNSEPFTDGLPFFLTRIPAGRQVLLTFFFNEKK